MDLVALAISLVGLGVVTDGYLWVGALLTVVPLLLLALALGRGRRVRLLLPFTYKSWYIVLPVAIVIMLLEYRLLMKSALVPLGLALYYYGGIALVEQRARYTIPGELFARRTATRTDRPVVYWLVVGLHFVVAGLCLAFTLAFLSGRVGPAPG